MNKSLLLLMASAPAAAFWSVTASAQVAATVSCPSGGSGIYKSFKQALAARPPSKGPLTITASGTCKENVDLSRLSGVTINGNPSVTITPAKASIPTITAGGTTTLNSVNITAGASGFGIDGLPGANIAVNSSQITGAGEAIALYSGGTLSLYNTIINVTAFTGLEIHGGVLTINAFNSGTTSFTSGNTGIHCEQSEVDMNSDSTSTISILNNPNLGLYAHSCNIKTYAQSPISFSGNGSSGQGSALDMRGGFATLINFNVSNNNGYAAIVADQGASIEIGNSTVSNDAGVALEANVGGIIHYANYDGVTTVQGDGTSFGCYQGGKQYADAANVIVPAPTASACLQIGGP